MSRSKAGPLSVAALLCLCVHPRLEADPLSKKATVDFYRDVPSRDLHGLATRSDGRIVGGPVLTDLKGKAPSQLLWCLEPGQKGTWLVGGGPGGRIIEVTADASAGTFTARDIAKVGEVQVYSLRALPDGSILAGTSPGAGLVLVQAGKVVARTGLPADSIFDLSVDAGAKSALVATGNPGRIFRVDLGKFAAAGVTQGKISDDKALEARGVTAFGEISDRNVRRIARLADGRVVAGSAPKGNLYLFPAGGGQAYIAQENHDAEVTDILADAGGGYFATLVYSGGEIHPVQAMIQVSVPQEAAITGSPTPTPSLAPGGQKPSEALVEIPGPSPQAEKFQGRSSLQQFSPEGFSETLTSRAGVAFYHMCRQGDLLILSGGELGEMSGFDLVQRLALAFPGSASAQVNALEPVPGAAGQYFAIRNNAPGFALLDFNASSVRTASTKRVDLGSTAKVGAVRFSRMRELDPSQVSISIRTTNGSQETDGWSAWTAMTEDDGWRAQVPAGRYAELKLELPAKASPNLELESASIYYLTQNHRPQLQDFRMLSPNFAIVVPPEMPAPVVTTVGQLIQSSEHDVEHRRTSFNGSQVVASPGTRVAFWTVNDADGDNLLYTFSIRHEGETPWTDISVDSSDAYVQFDTLHLREGTWFTRLVAKQGAPRPDGERLSVTFETDDLVVDHTPPAIEECSAKRVNDRLVVTVRGKDQLSLLAGADFTFNNGVSSSVEQPADGILDGKEETFVLDLPLSKLSGATSVEVTLYDAAGNGSTQRIGL
jgi:hypothetical protein